MSHLNPKSNHYFLGMQLIFQFAVTSVAFESDATFLIPQLHQKSVCDNCIWYRGNKFRLIFNYSSILKKSPAQV